MTFRRAAVVALALIGAAACSGSDDPAAPVADATSEPPPPTAGVVETEPSGDATDATDATETIDATDATDATDEPARTLVIDEPATVDAETATAGGGSTEPKDIARAVSAEELPEGFILGIEPVGFDVIGARVTSADGDVCEVCLWLAADSDERSQGLRGVTDLGRPVGMLFRWDGPTSSNFFMFETPTPLSIAWFDTDGAYVDATDMEPCIQDSSSGCTRYGAIADYQFAIEVVQGELDALGIGPGATLEVLDAAAVADCAG